MKVPYAAFPKYGPSVLGQVKYDAEMQAWKAYQASLTHQETGGGGEGSGLGTETEGEDLDTFTYIRKYTKPGQSRNRIFREQGIRATDKESAKKQGRDAMEDELGVQYDHDLNLRNWRQVDGSEKVVKPRGKSFEQGEDERRNEEGTNGSSGGGGGSGGAKGGGEGSGGGSGDEGDDGDDDDNDDKGEQDDTPKMPTCPECGKTKGSTEGCCKPPQPEDMPKPKENEQQPENDLMLLRTHDQSPLMDTEAAERVMSLAHIDTVDALTKSLTDVDKWTRDLVKHDVHAAQAEMYEAMTASHLGLKARIAKSGGGGSAKLPKDLLTKGAAAKLIKQAVAEIQVNSLKKIAKQVAEMIGAPRRIEVSMNGDVKKVTGIPHMAFEESLKAMTRGLDLFMVGPAGSGKGFLAQHLSEALGQRYGFISCSEGMSEGMLLGRGVPLAETFLYLQSSFVDFYENGGVFLLDEIDAANPNVLLIINECLSSPHLSIPNRVDNPYAVRHEHFYAIVAANTWGTGPNMEYVGRNRLDAAFLNRFVGSQIELGYDVRIEGEIAKAHLGAEKSVAVLRRFWNIRKKLNEMNIRRIWSTRGLEKMCMALAAGDEMATVLDAHTRGWTPDEKSKAGIV